MKDFLKSDNQAIKKWVYLKNVFKFNFLLSWIVVKYLCVNEWHGINLYLYENKSIVKVIFYIEYFIKMNKYEIMSLNKI